MEDSLISIHCSLFTVFRPEAIHQAIIFICSTLVKVVVEKLAFEDPKINTVISVAAFQIRSKNVNERAQQIPVKMMTSFRILMTFEQVGWMICVY